MPRHRSFLQILSVVIILTMLFSGFALPSVSAQGPDGIERQVNPQTGKVSFIGPENGRTLSAFKALGTFIRPQDPAMALAKRFGPEFGLKDPARDLSAMKDSRSEDGRITTRYQQNYQGIPVMGGELIVNTNDNGDLYSMNGEVASNLSLSTKPTIALEQARQAALQAVAKSYEKTSEDFVTSVPELWIYDESLLQPSNRPQELVWRMEITSKDAGMFVRELVLVNAQRGNISLHFNQIDTAWIIPERSRTDQNIDPTSTPLPTETISPTETPIPSETPIPTEMFISTEIIEEPAAAIPTEDIILTEEIFSPDASKGEVTSLTGGTWYVATTGNDSISCSAASTPCATIKGALAKAAAGDIIRVATGTYTGTGTTTNVVIIAKSITLSGGWNTSFTLQNGVSIIDGSGLRNGILANATGSLVTVESFIIQNSYNGTDSGGISIYGANFTLKNSSVINNAALGRGGGIFITNNATLTVLNSTISGNKARSSGGGIYAVNGTVSINNSTIVYNNSNGTGGGIAVGNSTVSIKNSLLARNTAAGGSPDCSGSITASDHNIIASTSGCTVMSGLGDQLNIDPLIDASSSGVIPFHALQVGSPAINTGDNNTCLAIDQRNLPRPQGSACDIGAYESAEEGRLLAVSGSGQTTTYGSPFPLVLTAYLFDSSATPVSGTTVTFIAPASGPSGTFADTGTNSTTVTTDGNGQASTSIFTANASRGFYSVSVTADGYSDVANFLLTNINGLFVATTGSDSNSCTEPGIPCLTINGAINKAVPGDQIVVASGIYTGSGTEVVNISKSITLSGGWDNAFNIQAGISVIDGQGARRGVTVTDANVTINYFTIQNGYHASQGGGIYSYGGTLTLNQSLISGNVSGSMGGGILNYGTLTVNGTAIRNNRAGTGAGVENYNGTVVMNNSTVSANVAVGNTDASGIVNGGNSGSSFTLNNSTVSSNTGDDAIYNSVGTLTLNNSTVSSNTNLGIRNQYGTAILQNSILANNSTSVSGQDCAGTITSLGHNLIGITTGCTFTLAASDQTNVNPMLNPSLIGVPAYHALLSNSPAIDAGDPSTCLATDQRGVKRPQGATCDIGAYEYIPSGAAASFGIASGNDQRTGVSFPFPLPLRVYVVDDSGGPVNGVDATFTAPASGPSGTFADTGTNTTTVPVNSDGVAGTSIFTANSELGTYEVVVTVSGLSDSVSFALTNSTLFVSPTGSDSSSCSSPTEPCLTISAAINKAATIDVIKVATGSYASIEITKNLTISGGWDNTFSSQIGYSTITGYSGIIANAPTISLSRLIVRDSHHGIYHSSGVLSFAQGALIHNDTGIHNAAGDITFTNTTMSGNHASNGSGSAIMNMNGNIRIQYSTITNNTGDYAIRSQSTDSAHIEIGNSILAENGGGDCYNPYKNLASTGHNIFGSSPACSGSSYFVPDPTDQLGIDPKLSSFLPVGYHPIFSNSPAVSHADPTSCPATDQRGVTRPQGDACDIGAYEYTISGAAVSFGIVSGSGQHSGPLLPFTVPLAVYAVDAFGNPVSGVNVTFTAPASGPGGTFTDMGNTTVAITNEDGIATAPVFTANGQLGTYTVSASASGLPGSVNFALTNVAWFVSPTGRDSNSCGVPTSPCLTIYGAIQKAVNGDGILVAIGTYGPINVTKSVSILGGWDSTFSSQIGTSTIDGNVTNHGIYASAPNISISRFVVQNSDLGIQHTSGTLSFEQGALINNNTGFYSGGGEATLTNTTISGNDATDRNGYDSPGSAIRNGGGFVRVRFSTITGNTGDYAILNGNSSAHVEIGNSILAGNAGGDCYIDSNSMTSAGHNILGNSPACSGPKGFIPDPTDQVGVDPLLLSLLPMGYDPISSTSPAIGNADPASCPATDQRGIARPQGSACDIGAYEYTTPLAATSFGTMSGSNQHSGSSLPFPLPLVVYVIDASGSPVGGVDVTFTAPSSGASGTFADTGTNITTVVTNEGGLATSPVFNANSELGAYNVTATISSLTGSVNFALVNATWFVSTDGSDTNSCNVPISPCLTIDAAVNKAANGDAIKVAVGTYSPVYIPKTLTLFGGWDSTFISQIGYSTVDGNFTSHGMSVAGQKVSISRFIVQNSDFGIYHSGTGALSFCRGASINNNNGLYNYSGNTIFTNVTISGNHAGDTNGYVYAGSAISNISGLVRVQYSTITNNGGTEAIWSTNGSAHIEIVNSILAGNPRGDCYAEAANMTSLGHNIFGSSPPCQTPISTFVPDPTDQVGVNPKLLPLFFMGYHPLGSDSPAIDAADPLGCPAIDQRGATRPAGAGCDIGAVEYTANGTSPHYIFAYEGSPQIIMINSAAPSRLIAIVFDEDGDRVQGQTVTFTAPDDGASAIFSETGTNSSTAVTDVNGFATSSAFSANSIRGNYFVVASVDGVSTPASFSLSNSTMALNPQVRTYTADNFISLPGTFLCNRTKPGCTNGFDVHADAAHKYAIGTYSLYDIEHSRNSINNAGMTIVSSVHYASAYANAAWTGSQMIYGDTYDYPLADDVVAHELTHGVTQYESNLFYYYQPGAINESFSDVWGEYYDQTNGLGNDSVTAKWLVGEDVSDLGALRSMSNPPGYGDPDKMSSSNYYTGKSDNGGVHSNSGVDNKAVFLMVDGGTFNGKAVSSLGWQKTAAIYYDANTNLLSSGADYSDLYYALQQACSNLVGQKGITSGDCAEVKDAIDAVEMNGQPISNFNADAPYCDQESIGATIFSDDLESGTGNWTFNNGEYIRWQFDSPYGRYAHSGNHFLFADDYPDEETDASAQLIPVTIPNNAYLHFTHAYDFDSSHYGGTSTFYDGGVIEYSIDGGTTWLDAGSLMDFNDYQGTIRTGFGDNPLQGRSAFVDSSHGYISTRLNLAALVEETVSFRWRMGLDIAGYEWGWWVDDVKIYQCPETSTPTGTQTPTPIATQSPTSTPTATPMINHDRDTTGVFRPSNGLLYLKNSNTTGFADVAINYGLGGDYPVVGDWDGNGTATIGIYRNGSFYLRNSNSLGFADLVFAFGTPGDQPIAGDWDGDGVDTIGVYRPSTGQFLLRNSNSGGSADMSFYLGNVGDVGIAGDWDGDGKDTTGVFRPSNGIIFLKNTNITGFADIALNYGIPGDKPVAGDWNNDGIDTIGVYRNGIFLLRNSNDVGFADISFGLGNPDDMPIAGNWDGMP